MSDDQEPKPVDPNRDFIVAALRYVVDHAIDGDEDAANLLRAFTIKSAIFDYQTLPEIVGLQVTFRDQLPEKITEAVAELDSLVEFVSGPCFDEFEGRGRGKSKEFSASIKRASAAIETLLVPEICSDEIEMYLESGGNMEPDFEYSHVEDGTPEN